jgi:hypothetical protein
MSSNPPPPITPNTNTNTNSTPNASNNSRVNVVTQPSQLTQEFDLVSTPQQGQRNLNDDEHDDFQLEHLLEHGHQTNHTPIMDLSTIPRYPTPKNLSPDV